MRLGRLGWYAAVALGLWACEPDRGGAARDAGRDLGEDIQDDVLGEGEVQGADAGDDARADADAQPDPEPVVTVPVGADACCLTVDGARAVWAEGGDLWLHDFTTGVTEPLVADPGSIQKDPTLSGDRVVFADDRDGDFDLWVVDLGTRVAEPLVQAPGDQDQPSLDGHHLAWVSRDRPPHGAREADIFWWRMGDGSEPLRLTDDAAEQAQPHVRGQRVVWTDYGNDPDGVYLPIADPESNNGDIVGWDAATGETFVVTDHPSKQLRAALDDTGAGVVWLDWRGINPEPKYSEFQLFGRLLGQPERLVAWSAWKRPDLWQRPALRDGVVAFIAESPDPQTHPTAVWLADLTGDAPPVRVGASRGFLDAVALTDGFVGWLGAGELALAPLNQVLPRGR